MLILFLVVLLIGRSGPNRNTTSSSIDATPSSSVASPRPRSARLLLTWQPRLLQVAAVRENLPRGRVSAQVKRSRGRAQLRSCGAATLPRHRHYRRPSEQRLPVSHSAGFGFVNGTYIQREATRKRFSASAVIYHPCRPPEHSSARAHRANMNANHVPAGQDAFVKLDGKAGPSSVGMFAAGIPIRSAESLGSYTAWFATGENSAFAAADSCET